MASRQTTKKLYQAYPQLKKGIEKAQQEIFCQMPIMNIRTGHQKAKKAMTGVYLNRYYTEPIDVTVRKLEPGYMTELQERRHIKREFMRRKGKGPPKKGSGKKKK